MAEQISDGDLTVEVKPRSDKDVLGKAFALMVEKLRRVIGEMQESIGILSSSAQQIVATTTQVASAATETATAVTETTATVEEVKQTAQLATQKAKFVSESAQRRSPGFREREEIGGGLDRCDEENPGTDGIHRGKHRPLERTGPDDRGDHALRQ